MASEFSAHLKKCNLRAANTHKKDTADEVFLGPTFHPDQVSFCSRVDTPSFAFPFFFVFFFFFFFFFKPLNQFSGQFRVSSVKEGWGKRNKKTPLVQSCRIDLPRTKKWKFQIRFSLRPLHTFPRFSERKKQKKLGQNPGKCRPKSSTHHCSKSKREITVLFLCAIFGSISTLCYRVGVKTWRRGKNEMEQITPIFSPSVSFHSDSRDYRMVLPTDCAFTAMVLWLLLSPPQSLTSISHKTSRSCGFFPSFLLRASVFSFRGRVAEVESTPLASCTC